MKKVKVSDLKPGKTKIRVKPHVHPSVRTFMPATALRNTFNAQVIQAKRWKPSPEEHRGRPWQVIVVIWGAEGTGDNPRVLECWLTGYSVVPLAPGFDLEGKPL